MTANRCAWPDGMKSWFPCRIKMLEQRRAKFLSFYSVFCMDAHANLAALADRHLGGESLTLLATPDGPTLANRLSPATRRAVMAGEMIHRAYKKGDQCGPVPAGVIHPVEPRTGIGARRINYASIMFNQIAPVLPRQMRRRRRP